jgi:hypothetical protein
MSVGMLLTRLLLLLLAMSSVGSCPCLHRATVLSTLYTATQGASWTRGTPWDVTNATFPCNVLDGSIVCNASISDVTKLALSKRGLSGVLPTELGSLVALEEFDVSENRLNGTLPDSLKQWVRLRTFNITSNNITGTLPASYAAWSHLKTFNALVNSLTGTLPPEYGRSTLNNWSASLELFGVFTNSLTGSLPADYGNWSRILFFTVAQNQLSGTLPPSYRKWARLQRVSFFDNNFTGSLPPEYSEWSSTISVFNARDNQLSGVIPEQYSERVVWSIFNFSFEKITTFSERFLRHLPRGRVCARSWWGAISCWAEHCPLRTGAGIRLKNLTFRCATFRERFHQCSASLGSR